MANLYNSSSTHHLLFSPTVGGVLAGYRQPGGDGGLTYVPSTNKLKIGDTSSNGELDVTGNIQLSGELLVYSTIKSSSHMYLNNANNYNVCLLYTSPSPRDATLSRMPSSA